MRVWSPRKKAPVVATPAPQGVCTCRRCTCPHRTEEHVARESAGHFQVFCVTCNDICLTHSLEPPRGREPR